MMTKIEVNKQMESELMYCETCLTEYRFKIEHILVGDDNKEIYCLSGICISCGDKVELSCSIADMVELFGVEEHTRTTRTMKLKKIEVVEELEYQNFFEEEFEIDES